MTQGNPHPDVLDAVRRLIGTRGGGGEPWLDPNRSAAAMETVGCAVADAVRPLAPEVLLTGDDSAGAVLAHIISRRLGVRAVPLYVEEGVIDIDEELVRGRRVALVVAHGMRPLRLNTVGSLMATHHGELVGIVEAIGSAGAAAAAPVPYVAIVDRAELRADGVDLPGGERA